MTDRSRWPGSISRVCSRSAGVIAGVVVVLLTTTASTLSSQSRSAYEELQTFSGVLNHIRLNYPDSLGYSELVAAAIRGVLRALDPHSYYVSRAEWERRSALERGELFTVGLRLGEGGDRRGGPPGDAQRHVGRRDGHVDARAAVGGRAGLEGPRRARARTTPRARYLQRDAQAQSLRDPVRIRRPHGRLHDRLPASGRVHADGNRGRAQRAQEAAQLARAGRDP